MNQRTHSPDIRLNCFEVDCPKRWVLVTRNARGFQKIKCRQGIALYGTSFLLRWLVGSSSYFFFSVSLHKVHRTLDVTWKLPTLLWTANRRQFSYLTDRTCYSTQDVGRTWEKQILLWSFGKAYKSPAEEKMAILLWKECKWSSVILKNISVNRAWNDQGH